MKIKKSGNIKKKSLEGNNKIITFRRCSKTNTSDRITKKTAAGYQKKSLRRGSRSNKNLSKAQVDSRKSLIQIVWHKQ